jgi:hypothetical protein
MELYLIGGAIVVIALIVLGILIGRRNKDKVSAAVSIAKEVPKVVTGTSTPAATTSTKK